LYLRTGYLDVGIRADAPVCELIASPSKHSTNRNFVVSPDAWTALLELASNIHPSSISFNFGMWESLQSKDTRMIDCHAHAHMTFSAEIWEKVIDSAPEECKKRMVLCRQPPENYWLRDCMELETHRLNNLRMLVQFQSVNQFSLVSSELKAVSSELKTVSSELKTVSGTLLELVKSLRLGQNKEI
jgi:hypothetical protein